MTPDSLDFHHVLSVSGFFSMILMVIMPLGEASALPLQYSIVVPRRGVAYHAAGSGGYAINV
jgi:hypothetical protein